MITLTTDPDYGHTALVDGVAVARHRTDAGAAEAAAARWLAA